MNKLRKEIAFYIFNKYFSLFYFSFLLFVSIVKLDLYQIFIYSFIAGFEMILFLRFSNITCAKKIYFYLMACILSISSITFLNDYMIYIKFITSLLFIMGFINYLYFYKILRKISKLKTVINVSDEFNVDTANKIINKISNDLVFLYSFYGHLQAVTFKDNIIGSDTVNRYLKENNKKLEDITKEDIQMIKLIEY